LLFVFLFTFSLNSLNIHYKCFSVISFFCHNAINNKHAINLILVFLYKFAVLLVWLSLVILSRLTHVVHHRKSVTDPRSEPIWCSCSSNYQAHVKMEGWWFDHLDPVFTEDRPDAQGHGQDGPPVEVCGAVDGRQVGFTVGADLKKNNPKNMQNQNQKHIYCKGRVKTNKLTGRQTGRQTDRQISRQTDR